MRSLRATACGEAWRGILGLSVTASPGAGSAVRRVRVIMVVDLVVVLAGVEAVAVVRMSGGELG